MAIQYSQTQSWSAVVELVAQENSIMASVASGLYQADAANSKIIRSVTVGEPTIGDYNPASGITYEDLTDSELDITMDQKKFYAFKVEDIDAMQSVPELSNPALVQAGKGLALKADTYAFGLYGSAGTTVDDGTYAGTATDAYQVSASTIDTVIGDAMATLDEKNAGPERVLVVDPKVFKLIVDDARATLTDNVDVFKAGYISNYYGFEVYKSNQLSVTAGGVDGLDGTHCLAMTKRALPFAASIAESEMIRLESNFADAHRGLFVFGAGVKWEDEMINLFLRV